MSEQVRKACVVGWPVEHSRSPLIHNYWLKLHGIAGEYGREAVPPDQFADFLGNLAALGYVGANVTLPHKEAAVTLTEADARARAIGAANTLWRDGDTLRSTNTDVEGFIENLNSACPNWDRGLDSAIVLGAGGAARAVIYALAERGVERIHVANRTFSRAEDLRERFGDRVNPVRWAEVTGLIGGTDLLVNTTSLGMAGQPELDIGIARLPSSAVVAELVYSPLETTLLARARQNGLRTADGLGMLLHQAVRGFELWFGVRPEVTPELRAVVEADLVPASAAAQAPEVAAGTAAARDPRLAKDKVKLPKRLRPAKPGRGKS